MSTAQVEDEERNAAMKIIQNNLAKLWVKKVQGKAHLVDVNSKLVSLKVSNNFSEFNECNTYIQPFTKTGLSNIWWHMLKKDNFQEELLSVEKDYESLVVKEIRLKQKPQ